jgi:hypothetical protein
MWVREDYRQNMTKHISTKNWCHICKHLLTCLSWLSCDYYPATFAAGCKCQNPFKFTLNEATPGLLVNAADSMLPPIPVASFLILLLATAVYVCTTANVGIRQHVWTILGFLQSSPALNLQQACKSKWSNVPFHPFLLRTSQGGELLDLVDPSHHSHRIHLCTATPQLSCQYVARCNAPACILHWIPVMDMSAQNRPWPSNTSALDLRKAIRSSSRRSNSFGHTTDDTCADLTCYKSVYIDHSRTMRHLRTHCEFVGELLLKVSDPRLYVQTKAYLDMMGR